MRTALSLVLDVLAAAFLAGAYAVKYFTAAKLGMRRWVNYHTQRWQDTLPLDALGIVCVVLVTLVIVVLCVLLWRARARLGWRDTVLAACMVLVCALYVGFTLACSLATQPAYYLIMPLLGLATLALVARNALALVR